jgi:uncharacterized sulfatase
MKKQNIVFFFSDQQRFDTLGINGQKLPVTPNLDKFSKEATNFTNAYTVQPVCGPARACLQSGLYPTQLGCFRNGISLPENTDTLAKYIKKAGYNVAYVGKWHLGSDNNDPCITGDIVKPVPLPRRGGYDDYWMVSDILESTSHGYDGHVFDKNNERVDFKGYRADCITDFALDYISGYNSDKPFFLFISHIEPHHQNDHFNFEAPVGMRERFESYEKPADLEAGEGDWEKFLPDYLGCCNALDRNFGRLCALLKEKGIYEDTDLIYVSDHGCHFRTKTGEISKNGGYDDYKRNSFESSIHIPLLIKGEGFIAGETEERMVSLIDLPRTLMTMAGCENISDAVKGRSIKNISKAENWDNSVYIQISESFVGRAVRTDRYKYVVHAPELNPWNEDGTNAQYSEKYLFDMKNDPLEKNNLVNDPAYASVKKELKRILLKYSKEADENITIRGN